MSFEETRNGSKPERNADDILSLATRTLKRRCDANEEARPSATRTRVMMSLRQQERRRTAAIYVLLPAAAVLVASTAWAAANGHLPQVVKSLGERLGLVEATPPAGPPQAATQSPPSVRVSESAALPESAPLPESAAPAIAAPPPASVESRLQQSRKPPAPVVPVRRERENTVAAQPRDAWSAKDASVDEPSDKLYETAHHAHFAERDWNAALAGWDRYLAASPDGRFVPEARYNRAIALLRLDRRDEAVRELAPFAEGKYGTYRRDEARELIDALKK